MTDVVPSKRQIEFEDWEFGLFLHLGMYSFRRNWTNPAGNYARQDPNIFQLPGLDCDQWIRTAHEAGMRYAVLTCKHHEGFCLWPSEYGDYSVKYSSWRNGKGDVVKEYTDACHKHGVKVGMYYSPYDASTPLYENDAAAYDDYFVGQMRELCTNYGDVDILWFDGCHSEGHVYNWERICAAIHGYAPNALIFNMGQPDFRWIGNEYGVASLPNWNVVEQLAFSVNQAEDSETVTDKMWLPAECDCRMRLHSWGYNPDDEHTIKSVDELMGLYYYSVGRSCNLLLNIGPNPDGLLPEKDAARLLEFGREIRRRLGHPLAKLGDPNVTRTNNSWVYQPGEPTLVDHVVLAEDIARGEHVRTFEIRIHIGDPVKDKFPPVTIYKGENVGHKAICSFPPVSAKSMVVEVTKADGEVHMKNVEFHCASMNT